MLEYGRKGHKVENMEQLNFNENKGASNGANKRSTLNSSKVESIMDYFIYIMFYIENLILSIY